MNLKSLKIILPVAVLVFFGGLMGLLIPIELEDEIISNSQDSKHEALAEWMNARLQDPSTGEIPANMAGKELMFAQTLPKFSDGSRSTQGIQYDTRGPYNVGGRTRAVAYDVSNLQTILAGGVNGGVWKSTNNGNSWKLTTGSEQMHNISALAQDTRNGKTNIWYCGTGEGGYPSSGHHGSSYLLGNGMYKSTDGGDSWTHLTSTANNNVTAVNEWSFVWNIATDPSNTSQDEVYAATNGAIMRSTDGGTTWVKELGGNTINGYAWVGVTSTGVVYAAIGNTTNVSDIGIWRSTDGQSWTRISGGIIPSSSQRIVFDIAPSLENIVYFLMRSPGRGTPADPNNPGNEYASLYKYEYLSGDGSGTGGRWTDLSSNIPSHQNTYFTFDSQNNYNLVIKVKPNNYNQVFIGGTNLFRSTDGFATKNNITQIGGYNPKSFTNPDDYRYPNQHPDQHALVFRGKVGSELLSATDGGIHYTTDCLANEVSWQWKNNGYLTAQFYTVAIAHDVQSFTVLGGTQDNGTQMTQKYDETALWEDPLKSDGSYCAVGPATSTDGSGIYYMSSQYGNTYKVKMLSDGSRDSYQRIEYPGNEQTYDFINPFVLEYNNKNVMFMSYRQGGVQLIKRHKSLHTIPLNNSRVPSTSGWDNVPVNISGRITCMKPTRKAPQERLYVACNSPFNLYRIDNSTSNTPSIKALNTTFEYKEGNYVSDIAVHPEDGNKILLCFSNYQSYSIYYSEDGGDNWTGVAGNLEDTLPTGASIEFLGLGNGPSVRSVAIVKASDGVIYFAATSTGLYATNKLDGHNTVWVEQASHQIGNTVVEKLDIRDSDNYMAIATHGKGMYSTMVTSSIPGSIGESLAEFETKMIAYPNPSTGNTKLKIEIPTPGEYILKVYDQVGRIKQKQNLGLLSEGEQHIALHLPELEKGIYYLNVSSRTVQFNRSIKFILE